MKSKQNRNEEGTALFLRQSGGGTVLFHCRVYEKRPEDQKKRILSESKKQGNGFVKVSQILRETKGN